MPEQSLKRRGVRGSRSGRPIMALLDLLGRRWTLRIMWELRENSLTSRALRAACDEASPTVLQARLSELREAGFIALGEAGGYGLTPLGRELCETFMPLHRFAERWRTLASPSPRLRGEGRGEAESPRVRSLESPLTRRARARRPLPARGER